MQKAEAAKQEATVVTLNAEIRRAKAKLLEEDLPKLQSLALKKVPSSLHISLPREICWDTSWSLGSLVLPYTLLVC